MPQSLSAIPFSKITFTMATKLLIPVLIALIGCTSGELYSSPIYTFGWLASQAHAIFDAQVRRCQVVKSLADFWSTLPKCHGKPDCIRTVSSFVVARSSAADGFWRLHTVSTISIIGEIKSELVRRTNFGAEQRIPSNRIGSTGNSIRLTTTLASCGWKTTSSSMSASNPCNCQMLTMTTLRPAQCVWWAAGVLRWIPANLIDICELLKYQQWTMICAMKYMREMLLRPCFVLDMWKRAAKMVGFLTDLYCANCFKDIILSIVCSVSGWFGWPDGCVRCNDEIAHSNRHC